MVRELWSAGRGLGARRGARGRTAVGGACRPIIGRTLSGLGFQCSSPRSSRGRVSREGRAAMVPAWGAARVTSRVRVLVRVGGSRARRAGARGRTAVGGSSVHLARRAGVCRERSGGGGVGIGRGACRFSEGARVGSGRRVAGSARGGGARGALRECERVRATARPARLVRRARRACSATAAAAAASKSRSLAAAPRFSYLCGRAVRGTWRARSSRWRMLRGDGWLRAGWSRTRARAIARWARLARRARRACAAAAAAAAAATSRSRAAAPRSLYLECEANARARRRRRRRRLLRRRLARTPRRRVL